MLYFILEHFCTNVKISDQNLKQKDEQTSKMQVIPTSHLFCLQSHYTRCDAKPCSGSSCPCSKNGAECNDACHMGRSELRTFIMPLQPTWNAVFMFNKRTLFTFRPWDSVPCLNTAVGAKVKLLKPAEVRAPLCDVMPNNQISQSLKQSINYSIKSR